ncbi:MAG: OmpA family protein, partial [Terriglobales bacterium]
LTVTDDRGLSSSCSAQGIIQMPPPPQASLAATLPFLPDSSLVNNIAKVSLDDVALRLQKDASARAVIIGAATDFELLRRLSPAMALRLAEERAVHAKQYLVKQKGIARGRIEVRHGAGMHTASVWIVPQGATFHGPGADFNESVIKR